MGLEGEGMCFGLGKPWKAPKGSRLKQKQARTFKQFTGSMYHLLIQLGPSNSSVTVDKLKSLHSGYRGYRGAVGNVRTQLDS